MSVFERMSEQEAAERMRAIVELSSFEPLGKPRLPTPEEVETAVQRLFGPDARVTGICETADGLDIGVIAPLAPYVDIVIDVNLDGAS